MRDAQCEEHLIVEKVPVLTKEPITAASPYPMDFWVTAEMLGVAEGRVEVALSHGVETVAGERALTVFAADVIWL